LDRRTGTVGQIEHDRICNSGFTQISAVFPRIIVTKHTLRKIEAIHLIREQRSVRQQELAFHARPFVLCGLPLRQPPLGQQVHRRRNGKFSLHVVAHPDYGLPYGQDRLIPIWVATLAVRQKNSVVRFRAAAEILEFFHLSKDGRHYRRIVEGFKRIFGATIFFGTEEDGGASRIIDYARFHFFDSMHLWFSDARIRNQSATDDQGENVVNLSQSFYDEINQHRIPVEREVLAALANAPGVLDFYVWLAWKSFTLRRHTARIPLLGPSGLAAQLGNAPYAVERTFRLTVHRWLRTVRALWPECPANLASDSNCLTVRPSYQTSPVRPTQGGKTGQRTE
jgi:hypothetical protein